MGAQTTLVQGVVGCTPSLGQLAEAKVFLFLYFDPNAKPACDFYDNRF